MVTSHPTPLTMKPGLMVMKMISTCKKVSYQELICYSHCDYLIIISLKADYDPELYEASYARRVDPKFNTLDVVVQQKSDNLGWFSGGSAVKNNIVDPGIKFPSYNNINANHEDIQPPPSYQSLIG